MTPKEIKEKTPQVFKAKKKVIDADRQKVIELFNPDQTEHIVKKYEAMGKWNDVSIDCDGDLILWGE